MKTESEKRLEISGELDTLALKMRSTAAKMQDCDHTMIRAHGDELAGASELAREWAKVLRKDAK